MKNFFHECEVINLKLQPVEISHKFYGTVITFNGTGNVELLYKYPG